MIPEWFAPVFKQFPIVAFVFLAAWMVLRWSDRRHRAELEREVRRAADVQASHLAELERVESLQRRETNNLRAEITRLRARITRLENALDDMRERE